MRRVVVDLDGTLIDCKTRQLAVLRVVARPIEANTLETIWDLKRSGQNTAAALTTTGMHNELANRVAQHWRELIEEPFWLSLDSVFETVPAALEQLRTLRFHVTLLTARQFPHWLQRQLVQLGLRELFDEVVVVDPATAVSDKARVLQDINPIAMIGDSESDGIAARDSSTRFIAVDTGQRSRQFLSAHRFFECMDSFDAAASHVWNHEPV